jgi:hypothetical protein
MGYIIGVDSETPTWRSNRQVVSNFDVPDDPANPTVIADHNQEYPAGPKYLKTIEGNGFIRANVLQGGAGIYFFENTAPIEDRFLADGFVDPYPEDMVGRTVDTSTSSFILIIDAFDLGQPAGLGGTKPVTEIEWFENLS